MKTPQKIKSFQQVISLWPSRDELAGDCDVNYGVVHQWHRRNSIPSAYWKFLIDNAKSRGIAGVTYELLSEIAKKIAKKKAAA